MKSPTGFLLASVLAVALTLEFALVSPAKA